MKPAQPNTKLTGSNQRPQSRPPSRQQTPFIITIDESSTESESDQLNSSPLESDPDDYYSANHPLENQLSFEEWKLQNSRLHGIPEVPEPIEKIDRGVQVSQNEPVKKNDTPVDAADEVKLILSLNRQNQVEIKINDIDTHHFINISLKQSGMKRKLGVEYIVKGEQVKRQKGSDM